MKVNWMVRIKNKAWWLTLVPAVFLLVQACAAPFGYAWDFTVANEQVASMRWLNANVVGRLPKQWELSSDGAAAVAVSGVISAETDAEDN